MKTGRLPSRQSPGTITLLLTTKLTVLQHFASAVPKRNMKRFFTLISSLLILVYCFGSCQNNAEKFCGATSKMGRQFVLNSNGLVEKVTSENVYKLSKHVRVLEMQYTGIADSVCKPYSIFAAEIELKGKVKVLATCVADSIECIKPTGEERTLKAPMREHLYALQAKRPELEVLCGVNADFFTSSNMVMGVMHKDGKCLKGVFDGGEPAIAFAIMKDGTARVITQDNYELHKENIQEAVGGRVHLVSKGEKVGFTSKTIHPRTAVGVSADHKKIILLVVDGRRPEYSAGVNFDKLATMLIALGADEAINLDGGGSSTFLIRNPDADKGFETRNRPTDKRGDRAVPNGLAVVYSN